MNREITPEKIQKSFLDGDISKEDAADLLISLINGSEDAKVRTTSIEVLEKLDFNDENTFKILENHLISDENACVRSSAARVIILNFLDEGLEPLEWSTKHDKSPLVIKTIIDTFESKKESSQKAIEKNLRTLLETFALNLGVVYEESRFFLDLEAIISIGEQNYTINQVGYKIFEILYNRMDPTPWLVIKNKHVEVLNINFFNWRYIKQNEELFESFSRLKYLDDYLNSIKKYSIQNFNSFKVPKSIGSLTFLKKLVLKGNNLHSIPESIKNLKMLLELDLSYNQFQEIPQVVKSLNSLTYLNMKYNNIRSVLKPMNNFVNSIADFRL
jgi:Leucine-rich repeat (LRR) protein